VDATKRNKKKDKREVNPLSKVNSISQTKQEVNKMSRMLVLLKTMISEMSTRVTPKRKVKRTKDLKEKAMTPTVEVVVAEANEKIEVKTSIEKPNKSKMKTKALPLSEVTKGSKKRPNRTPVQKRKNMKLALENLLEEVTEDRNKSEAEQESEEAATEAEEVSEFQLRLF